MKQAFLQEAIRIGDDLLAKAQRDKAGLFWLTMESSRQGGIIWRKAVDLYTGVSGISLFFIELYKHTEQIKYLHTAIDAMAWVIHEYEARSTHHYAFFSGRLGIAYTLTRLAEVTQNLHYKEQALQIAHTCLNELEGTDIIDDLINGTGGTVLGLLHLHQATGDPFLLTAIEKFVIHLLETVHTGKQGVYWDRSEKQIKGLCGLSHGAAGMGLVWGELAYYVQNPAFYWLTAQTIAYESLFFDESKQNWLDLRKVFYKQDQLVEGIVNYVDGHQSFFTDGKDMNAWCHGAAGIGLSRLRAFALLHAPLYAEEARHALDKTKKTDLEENVSYDNYTSFCLCHGVCGNADLFIEASLLLADDMYYQWAQEVGNRLLEHRQGGGSYASGYNITALPDTLEDTSLFMGNAGVGYFLLRLVDPIKTPSILAPTVKATDVPPSVAAYTTLQLSLEELQRILLAKRFKRTIAMMEQTNSDTLQYFWSLADSPTSNYQSNFMQFMQNICSAKTVPAQVSDVFQLEQLIWTTDLAQPSQALLFIQTQVQHARIKRLIGRPEHIFLNSRLQQNSNIALTTTDWSWPIDKPEKWLNNLSLEPSTVYTILQATPFTVQEIPAYPLVHHVLAYFETSHTVQEAITFLTQQFSITELLTTDIEFKIKQQIQQLLEIGFLTIVP